MFEEGKKLLKEIDLAEIIKNENCLESSMKLRETLRERYPEYRKEINLLVNVYEAGILEQIREVKIAQGTTINKLAEILEEEYGLERSNALWAIKTWAMAYGTDFDERSTAIEYLKRASKEVLYNSEVKNMFKKESTR